MDAVNIPLVRDRCTDQEWGSPDNHTPEDWYWAGRMTGDGFLISLNTVKWGIVFGGTETLEFEAFKAWAGDRFKGERNSKVGYHEMFDPPQKCRIDGCWVIKGGTKKGLEFWEGMGLIAGRKAARKRIPPAVFTLDRERRQRFFDGYFDADGYARNRARKITSVNYTLLADTLRLMQTLGMSGSIGAVQIAGQGSIFYDLYIHQTPMPLTITSVTPTGKTEETYTLSVDHERHAFSSEGLISKNSAADYFKLCTIQVDKRLKETRIRARMILQVHDEIVFECHKDDLNRLATEVIPVMAHVYPLRVPMKYDIEFGPNWGTLHEWNLDCAKGNHVIHDNKKECPCGGLIGRIVA